MCSSHAHTARVGDECLWVCNRNRRPSGQALFECARQVGAPLPDPYSSPRVYAPYCDGTSALVVLKRLLGRVHDCCAANYQQHVSSRDFGFARRGRRCAIARSRVTPRLFAYGRGRGGLISAGCGAGAARSCVTPRGEGFAAVNSSATSQQEGHECGLVGRLLACLTRVPPWRAACYGGRFAARSHL